MKKQFYITLGIVASAISILWGGYFYLWFYEISPLLDNFSTTQKNIQVLADQNEQYRKSIEPDLERNKAEYDEVRGLFFTPDRNRPFEFIVFIEGIAKRNNLIHSINTPPTSAAPTAQLTVSGTYPDVIKFLREIENDAFLIHVNSVAFQFVGNTSASIGITLQNL